MKKTIFLFFAFTLISLSGFCFSRIKNTGDKECSLLHNGINRTYWIHIPQNLDTTNRVPLLIALHGGRGTGKKMVDLTCGGFDTLANREHFIVVYPDGIGKNWNDGRLNLPSSYKAQNLNIDDVGFISSLIDEIIKTYNADPKRVYVTGMSNGALMTHRLAIELSEKIAAAAPVCGNIPADLKSLPKHAVALMIINGTNDPLVPFEGGNVHFGKRKFGKVLSTNESVSFWVKHNNINDVPKTILLSDNNIPDGFQVYMTTFGDSLNIGEVCLITINGGGHTWPGGWQYLSEKWIGKTCRSIDGCQCIWNFFKSHSK